MTLINSRKGTLTNLDGFGSRADCRETDNVTEVNRNALKPLGRGHVPRFQLICYGSDGDIN